MKISLKTAALSVILLSSMQPVLKADGGSMQEKKCIVKKDVAEAFVHLMTHCVATLGALGMGVGGLLLDEAVNQKNGINSMVGAVAGGAAGIYTIYNMPQWTDTHLLDKDIVRSRAQNITVFISRVLVPYWGVFVGEMINFKSAQRASDEVRSQDAEFVE